MREICFAVEEEGELLHGGGKVQEGAKGWSGTARLAWCHRGNDHLWWLRTRVPFPTHKADGLYKDSGGRWRHETELGAGIRAAQGS